MYHVYYELTRTLAAQLPHSHCPPCFLPRPRGEASKVGLSFLSLLREGHSSWRIPVVLRGHDGQCTGAHRGTRHYQHFGVQQHIYPLRSTTMSRSQPSPAHKLGHEHAHDMLVIHHPTPSSTLPSLCTTLAGHPSARCPSPRSSPRSRSRDLGALDVPVLLRVVLDRAVRAELAHLHTRPSASASGINIPIASRTPGERESMQGDTESRILETGDWSRTFAVVRMLFLIHSVRSWYASSTSASAWMSAGRISCEYVSLSHERRGRK